MTKATDHIDKKLREQAATDCPLTVAQIETAADENGRWDGNVWTFSEQGLILAVKQAIRMLPASRNEEAVTEFLEAQDALDNREYAGINGESYDVLMRRRNAARRDLDRAMLEAAPTLQGVADGDAA